MGFQRVGSLVEAKKHGSIQAGFHLKPENYTKLVYHGLLGNEMIELWQRAELKPI